MNRLKLKANLAEIKSKVKEHAPVILGVVGTIVATSAALYYRNQLAKVDEPVDPDAWVSIKIHPRLMENVRNGATLKYRQKNIGPDDIYIQQTTKDDFSEEMNERFMDDHLEDPEN
jgi:hypothetical protein